MADYSVSTSLADYKVGDRWIGISAIGPVTINGETPSNALTRVRMTFRLGQTTYVLDSDDDEISIDNAAIWEASIPANDDFLPLPGKWTWNLEFFQQGYDSPFTLYKGDLTVHDDVD